MHETTIARQLLEAVLRRARQAGVTRVSRVRGWVAETESLSVDSLQFHFSAHAAGTPAERAVLDLRVSHVEARCSGCGESYRPEHHLLVCPACGATEAVLAGPTGLGIDTMDVK